MFDLSHPLVESMPCYPGDPLFRKTLACCSPLLAAADDDDDDSRRTVVLRVHALQLGTHTGTHVDAPFHFFPSGQKLHEIPLAQFVGRAVVLDVRHLARERARISWADLAATATATATASASASAAAETTLLLSQVGSRTDGKADIVLLWTGWDTKWDTPAYFAHPYFARDVAVALHGLGAKIVGVDVLSPDETPVDENAQTEDGWGMHQVLLGRGVLICENLRGLGELVAARGEETWVSLVPLSLHDADGAPVRAYGWKKNQKVTTNTTRAP